MGEERDLPADIPEEYRKGIEKTEQGFWGGWIRRNWKKVLGIVIVTGLSVFLILTHQIFVLFNIVIFAAALVFGYFFWGQILEVPRVAVMEVKNKLRRSNLYLIPKNLFPNFDIIGTPFYFKDQDSEKDVLAADHVDFERGFIKCSYDPIVSNLALSFSDKTVDVSEKRSVDMLKENKKLNEEISNEVNKEIHKPRGG